MSDIFNVLLFQNTLRTATPVVLAALGCLMTQHVNITNIGIDGMMLIGAFFAVLGSYYCGRLGGGAGLCHRVRRDSGAAVLRAGDSLPQR